MKGRGRPVRGGAADAEMDNGAKDAEITLSFPLSVGMPAQKHRSSASERGREAVAWRTGPRGDTQLPFKPPRRHESPSSSSTSSSPIDLTASARKETKPASPFPAPGSGPPFQKLPAPRAPSTPKARLSSETPALEPQLDGVDTERLTAETAKILFNLSAVARQAQGDAQRLEHTPGANLGSPPSRTSLHQPNSYPPPPSFTPPPPGPPRPLHHSSPDVPEQELLCGVCHRLFSSASSLTVHMRLHRGGRTLSCKHCAKPFIHNKRLLSHEAQCRQALPSPALPKQEPPDRDDEGAERGEVEEQMEPVKAEPGRPAKKGRGFLGRHPRVSFAKADLPGDEDHLAKVVDGHVIYFCTVCERSYMTLSSLKRHSNVHSWRRKYPCHFCDKVFALAEYRTKHEVWHTGERRYQCIFCWEAFATYYNLKTHQKAFHGISPGLISSEKTANGGYKQKVNGLKLYRLLPMRSQKRPYKTYSQSLAEGLLLPGDPAGTLPLDCSLSPADLDSFISESHPRGLKPDPDQFPFGLGLNPGDPSSGLAAARPDMPPRSRKREASESERPGSSGSPQIKTPKGGGPEAVVSSVITFARPQPSVIVHGAAVSSSVIVHSNQVSVKNNCASLETLANQLAPRATQRPMKKHKQRQSSETKMALGGLSGSQEFGSGKGTELEKPNKARKAHGESDAAASRPVAPAGESEVKGAGPLCQITVRIGEEAMVKRSISETDLMRDKGSPGKAKKSGPSSPQDPREMRHAHHHHRHRHRPHRSTSQQEETEPQKKSPKAPGKVREYYFRQEVREEDSDAEDNLWRPYYSYKPKRKALHMQKVKNWTRKMHYKRSLRLMKRAESLANRREEEKEEQEGEEPDEEEEPEVEEVDQKEGDLNTPSVSLNDKSKAGCVEGQEQWADQGPPVPSPQPALATSECPDDKRERHWSMGQASECRTCGRWFSSARKRDRHELTHPLCPEPLPSLIPPGDHQRAPRAEVHPAPSAPTVPDEKIEAGDGTDGAQSNAGSPRRLGRGTPQRHACPRCHKVCKTAAALGRHARRHEFSSSPEGEEPDPEVQRPHPRAAEVTAARADRVQPVPVISYPRLDLQPSERLCQARIVKAEYQTLEPSTPELKGPAAQDPSSRVTEPLSTSPTPAANRPPVLSVIPQGVLVLNNAECLDYRTHRKRSLDSHAHARISPVPQEGILTTSQTRVNNSAPATCTKAAAQANPMATMPCRTVVTECQRPADKDKQSHRGEASHTAQDLRVPPLCRSPCASQAQDLTMTSILARERRLAQQTAGRSGTPPGQPGDLDVPLLVPKEEPRSPAPSPTPRSVVQATTNGSARKRSRSPHTPPTAADLLARTQAVAAQSRRTAVGHERQMLPLATGASGGARERPSAHALLLPRAPPSAPQVEAKDDASPGPMNPHGGAIYPVQELPLVLPGGFRSGKKQEESLLVSYPTGPLSFGPLGKMVPNGDHGTKLPFYPDPYHLLYGPQLLAYPYNLAALPMALNMMAPGEQGEPMPFLPALFNYAAAAAAASSPYAAVNPALYSSSGGSGKKRDSTTNP